MSEADTSDTTIPPTPVKPKFTAWPWYTEGHVNGMRFHGVNGERIGHVSRKADKPIDQKKADIALIAAAPELYEALECLLDALDQGFLGQDKVDAARATLAKARGES